MDPDQGATSDCDCGTAMQAIRVRPGAAVGPTLPMPASEAPVAPQHDENLHLRLGKPCADLLGGADLAQDPETHPDPVGARPSVAVSGIARGDTHGGPARRGDPATRMTDHRLTSIVLPRRRRVAVDGRPFMIQRA